MKKLFLTLGISGIAYILAKIYLLMITAISFKYEVGEWVLLLLLLIFVLIPVIILIRKTNCKCYPIFYICAFLIFYFDLFILWDLVWKETALNWLKFFSKEKTILFFCLVVIGIIFYLST